MNIVDTIKRETRNHRDKTAVIESDRAVSYDQLFAAVDGAAEELTRCGVAPAHRVALLCGDSIEYIVISLAVLSLSAGIVPISPFQSPDEVDRVVGRMDTDFFIFDRSLFSQPSARPVFSRAISEKSFFLYRRTPELNLPDDYKDIRPAFIRFSSGTTGASKGVVLSHRSIIERTDAADTVLKIAPDDVIIWVLSMSYHFVVTILLFLRRAATIVLCGGAFPESLEDGLHRHKGTFIYASPFHYHLLTQSPLFSPEALAGVRMAVTTAMKQPVSEMEQFSKKFGFDLTEAYGIIEVGLPFINRSTPGRKRGSVGHVLPDYQVKIDRPDENGVGKVHLKGKGMFDAYFSPWQPCKEVLHEGWFDTGDLGRLDGEGYLYLVGREKNVINFTGMKIFPYEVEAVLNRHPAIQESLVYPVPHPHYGELPAAKIVLKDKEDKDIDTKALRRFCYQHLAPYKVPKEYHFVEKLEKTASGKLKRCYRC